MKEVDQELVNELDCLLERAKHGEIKALLYVSKSDYGLDLECLGEPDY